MTKKAFTGALIVVGSILGFVASFLLTIDKIKLLKDSKFVPSCNINEILNCKSVMLSSQAEVFGFPNSLLGIAAFAIFLVVGISLMAGVQFPRWFWRLALVGALLGIFFSHWLAYQTTFEIGALCPYCMVAWIGNFFILSSVIQENIRFKVESGSDEEIKAGSLKIMQLMPVFHLLWTTMVIGYAFIGVR
jgi:uncharacterized membrane protein